MGEVEVLERKASTPRRLAADIKDGLKQTGEFINRYRAYGYATLALFAANVSPASAHEQPVNTEPTISQSFNPTEASIGASTQAQIHSQRVRVYEDQPDLLSGVNQIEMIDAVPADGDALGLNGDIDGSVCQRAAGLANWFNANAAPGMRPRFDMLQGKDGQDFCEKLDIPRLVLPYPDAQMPNHDLQTTIYNTLSSMKGYTSKKEYVVIYEGKNIYPGACGSAYVNDGSLPTKVPSIHNLGITYIHQPCDQNHTYWKGFSLPDVVSARNIYLNFAYKFTQDPNDVMLAPPLPLDWKWWLAKTSSSTLETLNKLSYITQPMEKNIIGNGLIAESVKPDPGNPFNEPGNTERIEGGKNVTLKAIPGPNSHFVRWTGDCETSTTTLSTPPATKSTSSTSTTPSATCNLVMDGSKNIGAVFEKNTQPMKPIVVQAVGQATLLKHLTITSTLSGDTIRYPADLKGSATSGSKVTLIASVPRKEARVDWRNKDCENEVETHTVLRNIARCSFKAGNKTNPHVLYVLKSA